MKSVDDIVAELRIKIAKNLARDVGIVSIDCDDALALSQMAADFAVMLAEGKRAIATLQREADGLRTRAAAQTKLIRDLIRATDPVAHDNRDAEAVLTTVWRLLSVASQEAYIEEATRNLSPQDQAKEGSER